MNTTKRIMLCLPMLLLASLAAWALEDGQTVRLSIGGKSLMMENSTLETGKNAVLWTETGTNSQRWVLSATSRGTFYMLNAYSDLYLGGITAAGNNAAIGQVAKSVASTRGQWELVPVEGKTDEYVIYISTAKRFALAAPAEVTEGCNVTLITAATADASRITWRVEAVEPQPNTLTKQMRDDMMEKWKAHYYHKASTGYVIGNGGWWGDAEMFEVVLDALETTGDQQYATMFDNLYENFIARNRSSWYQSGVSGYNEYNDDIAWMCIACVRAYLMTGLTKYLTTARTNFDGMYKRANIYGDGTLVWKQPNSGTNSCINGPAAVCACYLAQATNNTTYYDKAATIYAGQRAKLMEKNADGSLTGKVWDSYNQSEGKVGNYWASTYNQGTNLGAALMLYQHYGDEMYRKDAEAIATWTRRDMCNSSGIIKVCQTVSGDLTGFKGILLRYMRRYAAELDHPDYYTWLASNAYHAWNNRNSKGISMSAWLSKTPEDFNFHDGGSFDKDGVGAFTALSAAFNAHLGVVDHHSAYERTEAEHFNFIRNAPITDAGNDDDGTGMAGAMRNNHYIGFRNVDFGGKAASHIDVRAYLYRTTAKVNIYIDGPDNKTGQLICQLTYNDGEGIKQWATLSKELNIPVKGQHKVYLVVTGTANADLASVNWLQFRSEHTIYADLTNNGGALTTSLQADGDDLARLTDDDVTTGFVGAVTDRDGTEDWVEYTSPAPILLQGYTLYSGLSAADPTAWRLLASNDGETWTTLHEQADVKVSTRAQRFKADVETAETYTRFRLVLSHATGAATLALAEWQLLGRAIAPLDITADGGSLTSGPQELTDHQGLSTLSTPLTAVYKANGNYMLTAYSLTSTQGTAPAEWTLEGSANGTSWTTIDTQADALFPYAGSTVVCRVVAKAPYMYYRLRISGEGAELAQWQLHGTLDFGTFYADITSFSLLSAHDGSLTPELCDNQGTTCSTIAGDEPYWQVDTPYPVKVIGFSAVCGDDADLDPQDITIYGLTDEGTANVLYQRTVTFAGRGARVTSTISSSINYRRYQLSVRSTSGGRGEARLAELELFTTAIATADDEQLHLPQTVEASAAPVLSTEGVERLNDQSRTTRYRAAFTEPVSITFHYGEPTAINAYALTSSKDLPTCDPTKWTLEGSYDGAAWTPIDRQDGQSFSNRYATQFYPVTCDVAYSHYRLTVEALGGGANLQLGELQLLSLQMPDATAIAAPEALGGEASIACVEGQLHVSAPEATTLRLYDATGQMLMACPVVAGNHTVALPAGRGLVVAAMSVGGRNVVCKIMR